MVMGEHTRQADTLIIGGGPAGYAAAFRAADLGMEVVMVDTRKGPGGVCLYEGCIPSKTYLTVSRLIHRARAAAQTGVSFDAPRIDVDDLRRWKEGVVERLAGGILDLGEKRGVTLIRGRAVFEESDRVRILDSEAEVSHVKYKHALIATGSSPAGLQDVKFEPEGRIMNSTGALALPDIPESLLVIGGGYVGVEMGSVYAALGSRVTLVEAADRLLAGADGDLVDIVAKTLAKRFESIRTGATVEGLEEDGDAVRAAISGVEGEKTFDRVLVAVGRRPNSAELGLENTDVRTNGQGGIVVDDTLCTADPHIYAAGDVVGGMLLAHKAMAEGKVAVEAMAGKPSAFDVRAVPAVVYTDPELAWCGLTEQAAENRGQKVKAARFSWGASGRAATMGISEGMTKLVLDPETGRVLGVGIAGREAGEMIAEGALAVEMGALAEDLALTLHPHPTLSEGLGEAAGAFLGRATHMRSPREIRKGSGGDGG